MIGFRVLAFTCLLAGASATFPSARNVLPSPNGRSRVVSIDREQPDSDGNWHELYVESSRTAGRMKLLAYGRHVGVVWAPSSNMVAVTDYQGSDYARTVVFRLNDGSAVPEQVTIEDLLKNTPIGSLLQTAGHRYVTAERWTAQDELVVRVRGYGGALRTKLDELLRLDIAAWRVTKMKNKEGGK